MAFCTNCGGRIADGGRFCPNCGQAAGSSPGAAPTLQAPPPKLDYTIEGSNLQFARVRLKAGQEVYAEAGRMVYKTQSIQWDTRMMGSSIGDKIWSAVKRKLMGESLFLTYFLASSDGEVGFAGSYPGKIKAYELAAGQSVIVQRDSFLFAQPTVTLNIAMIKKLGTGFFGGEGFILEKLTGPGTVFIHAGGDFAEFDLGPGDALQVETGCIVGFDDGVGYDIEMVGGIKSAIFGGEGLFLATLRGPGKVVIQSMTLQKMRRELAPSVTSSGDERTGLGAITDLFGSND
jgi:uncharacterized protein (TIGR00266 family)